MTAKLMLILLGLGLTSLALLSLRQHRIDTAFEMTRLHDRCDQVRTLALGYPLQHRPAHRPTETD